MRQKLTIILTFLFLCIGAAMAQVEVKGTVVSADDKQPIIGATVKVKESSKATAITDIDGNFSLRVPSGGKTLVITYIGMKTEQVKIGNKTKFVIEMSGDDATLDEVVVTGMQKMDKRLFTGATAKVDGEKAKLDGIADVSRALEGRVAGVTVQNVSGTFGTAPKIRVRGATSIYGSSKPLWVVDGVILEDAVDVSADDLSSGDAETLISNAIAGLSADDIESFQVLKDGSATSIYGARAMAGVVVITTKRGKAGKSTINYTGEFTYRLKPSYRDYNICNSQEQMGIYKEMQAKGWLEFSHLANNSTSGLYGQMYKLMKTYDTTSGQFGLPNTEAAMNDYLRTAEFRNTDWFDLLFKENIVQNHSVSISTGSDKANLYASVSVLDDQGWSLDSRVQRYTANMNATFNLSKKLSVSILTKGNYRKQEAPGTLARETDVVSGTVSRSFDINPFSYAMNTSRTLDPTATYKRNYADFNIFDELDNNYINLNVMDMMFHGETSYKPFLGLELKALVAYRTQNSVSEHFIKNHSNQAEAYRAGVDDPNVMNSNIYLYSDPDQPNSLPISVMPTGGIYTRTDNTVDQLDFRLSGNYNKVWNDTHIFNAYVGMEINKTEKEKIFHSDYGVDYENGRLVTITPEFFKQAKEEGTELSYFNKRWTRNIAYFANLNYSYKGRYTLNATGRYEGTNKLGRSRSARWLPTWNIAGGWNVHEEGFFKKFMQNTNGKFSHLAFRASYSLTADRGPSSVTNALPIMRPSNVWRPEADQIETVIYLSNIANSELTYEKKHELNIGMDAGFFNNRVNLNFDIYWRNNFDLIGYIQTEGVGGVINKMANVATMKAHGFDGTISTQNIKTKTFSWNTDFTFAYNKDEITDLKSRSTMLQLCSGTGSNHFREGYARSALFSIPFVRLTDEGIPVVINEDGEETSTDINFQEYDNLDHLIYEGPMEPTVTGGLNNTIRWKNWRLNVFVTYSFGNKVRLARDFSSSYSDMSSMSKDFKNRWVQSGDENITTIPAIASKRQVVDINHLSYAYNAYNYSSERVADAGFIRLKDVSLTYDVSKKLVRRIGLNNISCRLAATNLCLLYADKKLNGQDPEFINAGGVATPLSRQFTFTLKLGI